MQRINAQVRWNDVNRFAIEPSDPIKKGEAIATDWLHLDVRTFKEEFLKDTYFCKNQSVLNGKSLTNLLKEFT